MYVEIKMDTHKKLIERLWRQLTSRRKLQIFWCFVLMIFSSIAEMVSIGAVVPFIGLLISPESFIDNSDLIEIMRILHVQNPMIFVTSIFCAAAIISGIMRLLLTMVQTKLSYSIGADIGSEIFYRSICQPYESHSQMNSSEIVAAVANKATSVVNNTVLPLLTMVSSTVILCAVYLSMLIIDKSLVLYISAIFFPFYILVGCISRKKLNSDSITINKYTADVIKIVTQGLGGVRDIILDGSQKTYKDLYIKVDKPLKRAQANVLIIGAFPRYVVESAGIVMISCVAYYETVQSQQILTIVPFLGALALAAQRMLPLVQGVFLAWSGLRGNKGVLKDTVDMLDTKIMEHKSGDASISFCAELELHNVSYRYINSNRFALSDLNIRITKGQKVGFIGETGSGKSTILDLLMGLLTPNTGSFSVDGIIIKDELLFDWRKKVAHVPQNVFLIDGTLADNIAFGVPKNLIDKKRVELAIEVAQLNKFITSTSFGTEYQVGENGARLSGGQRQRIGIARAIYRNADILILDEATSALDMETEAEVMNSINSFGEKLTILIVAHRISTLKYCDVIYKMDDGKIVDKVNYNDVSNY